MYWLYAHMNNNINTNNSNVNYIDGENKKEWGKQTKYLLEGSYNWPVLTVML